MRNIRITAAVLVFLNMLTLTGCWNYREINRLGIVMGVAVDKGSLHRYNVTFEIVRVSAQKDAKPESEVISAEGDTMFEAARNSIKIAGRRLYWPHAKILIISRDIARQGIIDVIDWYVRDAETRVDVNILISAETTAAEIFQGKTTTETMKSFELYQTIKNERNLGTAPITEMWGILNALDGEGVSAVAPLIMFYKSGGKMATQISGTAIFKYDKMIGTLDEDATKDLLFIRNEIKYGVLPIIERVGKEEEPVSLEIFGSKTRVRPVIRNGNVEMDIDVKTTTAIDEIGGSYDFIDNGGLEKLIRDSENMLRTHIENTIEKVQKEYGVDIFGFGAKIREDQPELWKGISGTWDERFRKLKVNVTSKINIKNSSMLSKTIETGD